MRKKKADLTPEGAARIINSLVDGVKVRDARHAVELHPELEVGLQAFESGSTPTPKPASRGSGPVAVKRPAW